ncbi:MAG: hypothetical protein HGB05_03530, partial [Chloroflexi bacterium]|nr:hypothetical protein [Chloroflexota bacterium]
FLAVGPNNHVFITDPEGYRIIEFSSDGEFVRTWGDFGTGNTEIGLAAGVTVDPFGYVWVTDAGNGFVPLEFRFHVSLCGSLGVGGNLLEWNATDRALARRNIALYKELRPIIQLGDQYRLRSPEDDNFSAVQYLSKDKSAGVLCTFRVYLPDPAQLPPLYLRGLDPNALYEIEGEPQIRSGLAWMRAGLSVELHNLQSVVKRIRRVISI